jgi:nitrate reductase NapD
MNIAGVVVFSNPQANPALSDELNALAGVEVHAISEEGKMVVTIEEHNESALADTVVQMQNLSGVLSASMVYHHNEDNIN